MALVDDEKLGSHNLRDFLSIRDDVRHSNLNQSPTSAGDGGRHSPSGLTLYAILNEKRSSPPPPPRHPASDELRIRSSRTLLDVIREDRAPGRGGGRGSWRNLRGKIRLRHNRGGGGGDLDWPSISQIVSYGSTHPGPSVDRDEPPGQFEDENVSGGVAAVDEEDGAAEQPARMSLMALLAENDRHMGVEGSAFAAGDDGASEAAEAVEESFSGGVICCVCMVRGKGAAFIPCGHTFCRPCSRELLANRGNCPLCNNRISEILDLF